MWNLQRKRPTTTQIPWSGVPVGLGVAPAGALQGHNGGHNRRIQACMHRRTEGISSKTTPQEKYPWRIPDKAYHSTSDPVGSLRTSDLGPADVKLWQLNLASILLRFRLKGIRGALPERTSRASSSWDGRPFIAPPFSTPGVA